MMTDMMTADMKVLMNHIYEYKKGVRQMVLYTCNKKYESFATLRLEHQNIPYIIQPVGRDRMNLFFGRQECLDAIQLMITKPLNQLTPERILFSVQCWDMTFAYSASGTVNASAALVNVRHKPELLNDNLVREINYFIMFLYYK